MKYNSLSSYKSSYYFKPLAFLKTLLSTHIKTSYTNPRNTIFYSARYNSGERFLLNNKSLYPFDVKVYNEDHASHPNNLAYKLDNNIRELELKNIELSIYNNKLFSEKELSTIEHSFSKVLTDLYKSYKYVEKDKLELSAFVLSRIIYSISNYNKLLSNSRNRETNQFTKEDFEFLVEYFIDSKLKYADAESFALVLSAVAGEKGNKYQKLYKRLSEVKFESEFTKVNNISPHLFKYSENTSYLDKFTSLFKDVKIPYVSCNTSKFSKEVLLNSDRALYLTYNALINASKNNSLADEALTEFNDRFSDNKYSYLRENLKNLNYL